MAFGYSVMLDLTGRRALVAGGGEVAARKIRRLLTAGAEVTAIAPAFSAEIAKDCARGLLRCERRAFQLADIAALDPFIVFAATDDAALNKAIAAYCDAAHILVNAITDPQNGNFSVQAEIPRARYAVSVSTYGQGPGFAKALREYLEPVLDERLDLAVEVYIGVRQWLLASVDDPKQRQAQMRRLSLKRIYELIDAGITDHDELSERVKEWLSCSLD